MFFSTSMQEAISIHALREEGDLRWKALIELHQKFLSTPSARRATRTGWPNCS